MIETLGHYHIESLIGEGAFALVYRAVDQKLKRPVALKALKPMWMTQTTEELIIDQEVIA